jgi:hypothetical protein
VLTSANKECISLNTIRGRRLASLQHFYLCARQFAIAYICISVFIEILPRGTIVVDSIDLLEGAAREKAVCVEPIEAKESCGHSQGSEGHDEQSMESKVYW